MRGLDRQLEYERVACEAAEDFVRRLEPLFAEIYEAAEVDTRWEVAWGALKKLGKALAAADFALPRGFVRRPNPKRKSAAVSTWAVAASDGTLIETYFDVGDALDNLEPGFRVVHLEESGRTAKDIDDVQRAKESEADAWNRSQCLVEKANEERDQAQADFEWLGNIVMAMAFDRERENEHNRTTSECAFCRERIRRDAKAMASHMLVCGLHPAHALMSAARLVRDGEFGPLPLAALAKLNEAIVEVSP